MVPVVSYLAHVWKGPSSISLLLNCIGGWLCNCTAKQEEFGEELRHCPNSQRSCKQSAAARDMFHSGHGAAHCLFPCTPKWVDPPSHLMGKVTEHPGQLQNPGKPLHITFRIQNPDTPPIFRLAPPKASQEVCLNGRPQTSSWIPPSCPRHPSSTNVASGANQTPITPLESKIRISDGPPVFSASSMLAASGDHRIIICCLPHYNRTAATRPAVQHCFVSIL